MYTYTVLLNILCSSPISALVIYLFHLFNILNFIATHRAIQSTVGELMDLVDHEVLRVERMGFEDGSDAIGLRGNSILVI